MNPFARSLAAFGLGALCSVAGSLYSGIPPSQGGMALYPFDMDAGKNTCGDACEQSWALFAGDEPEDASGGSDPEASGYVDDTMSRALSP